GLTVVEVKTGKEALLTPNQAIYFPVLMLGGHIYSTDPRISQLGLVPGVPFPPLPVVILHAPGPNLPYKAFELPLPQFEPLTKANTQCPKIRASHSPSHPAN